MSSYIDADSLARDYSLMCSDIPCESCPFHIKPKGCRIKNMIVRAPKENVAPIVRCKDCTHYHPAQNECNGDCDRQYATFYPMDYCSYGNEKEGLHDGEPCNGCPYRAIDYVSGGTWCYYCHINGAVLDKRVEKPEWCPLNKYAITQ